MPYRATPRLLRVARRAVRASVTFGVAAVLTATLAPAALAAPADGVLIGTVRGADGAPLARVTVELGMQVFNGTFQPTATATTSAAGVYRMTGDFRGSGYQLQFLAGRATGGTSPTGYSDLCFRSAPRCASDGYEVRVAAGATRTVDVRLARAGVLSGRVRDSLGRGVGGLPVTFWDQGVDQSADSFIQPAFGTVTDANGNYTVRASPDTYVVCFGVDGLVGAATPAPYGYVGVCLDRGASVAAGKTTLRNTVLAGAGLLVGTVVDTTGAPVAATVFYDSPLHAVGTAADGTFRLPIPPGDAVTVYISTADDFIQPEVRIRPFTVTRQRFVVPRAS